MIQQLDTDLLLWLNGFHNLFFDNFMWNFTQSSTWIPLYISLIACLFYRFKWSALWLLFAVGLAVGLSDFVASSVFKPLVARLRPSHVPELQEVLHIVNEYRGGQFGFMSSHAANSFALVTLVCLCVRTRALSAMLFVWAALNAYSRIYLGVHYPGDVICGAALGGLTAYLLWLLLKLKIDFNQKSEAYSGLSGLVVFGVCLCTILYCAM